MTIPTRVDHHTRHEQRMRDWHGLRVSEARPCLRVVAGKRCTADNWTAGRPFPNCICISTQAQCRHLFDHCRIWLDTDGRHVLTSEPYNYRPGRLAELQPALDELGVAVSVADRSPWYPGSTTLLMFTRTTP